MLRLANKQNVYPVPFMVGGERTIFNIKAMSVADQFNFLGKISTLPENDDLLQGFLDTICPYIVSIDGYDESPEVVLTQLENKSDFTDIIREFRTWLSLTDREIKNFVSSSEQRIQESAGSAEKTADQVEEPASTTTEPEQES